MKIIIQGYNKSIHKKNNQIIVKEKEDTIYKTSPKKVTDILIIGKGYITFDALTLIAKKQHTINFNKLLWTIRLHPDKSKR